MCVDVCVREEERQRALTLLLFPGYQNDCVHEKSASPLPAAPRGVHENKSPYYPVWVSCIETCLSQELIIPNVHMASVQAYSLVIQVVR